MKKLQGIYLVIDPKRDWDTLLKQLIFALEGGLNIIQIWNNWESHVTPEEKALFIKEVQKNCFQYAVPVLMHNDWQLALACHLDGVHFDDIPKNFNGIKTRLKDKIIGLTVSNDLNQIKWADQQGISYISFCAVFPSKTVDSCEIVRPENILAAKSITGLSIFLSGGITPENVSSLDGMAFDGLAVISGILDSTDPTSSVKLYKKEMEIQKEKMYE